MIWQGLFYSNSGYAEAARQSVLALEELGAAVTVRPLDEQSDRVRMEPAVLGRLRALAARRPGPHELRIQHIQPPRFSRDRRACANVGCTMFETDRLPRTWLAPCNAMEEIWVPSGFCAETFAQAGVEAAKIQVVPYGVDTERFGPHVAPVEIVGARGFVFLSIFYWSLRKGWDILLRAYLSEFKAAEDVCLVIRAPALDHAALLECIATASPAAAARPPIIVLPFAVPDPLLPGLYAAADAFVLPSRGEGWGLPYIEAMASGKPTIGTRWGGQLEFMTDENSYLIAVERFVPIDEWMQRITGAEPDHQWAEPSLDHLRELMRKVYEDRQDAHRRAAAAREHVVRGMTWRHSALKIVGRVEALGGAAVVPGVHG